MAVSFSGLVLRVHTLVALPRARGPGAEAGLVLGALTVPHGLSSRSWEVPAQGVGPLGAASGGIHCHKLGTSKL